jgi:hypothetical protein
VRSSMEYLPFICVWFSGMSNLFQTGAYPVLQADRGLSSYRFRIPETVCLKKIRI